MSGVRRQSERLPLRPAHMRVVQRLLQAHRAEQEALLVRRQANVSDRQTAAQTMCLLPFPEVPASGHEARGGAREPCARRSQQVRAALSTLASSQATNTQAAL